MKLTQEEFDALEWIKVERLDSLSVLRDHLGNEISYPDVEYCECCGCEIGKDDE